MNIKKTEENKRALRKKRSQNNQKQKLISQAPISEQQNSKMKNPNKKKAQKLTKKEDHSINNFNYASYKKKLIKTPLQESGLVKIGFCSFFVEKLSYIKTKLVQKLFRTIWTSKGKYKMN